MVANKEKYESEGVISRFVGEAESLSAGEVQRRESQREVTRGEEQKGKERRELTPLPQNQIAEPGLFSLESLALSASLTRRVSHGFRSIETARGKKEGGPLHRKSELCYAKGTTHGLRGRKTIIIGDVRAQTYRSFSTLSI